MKRTDKKTGTIVLPVGGGKGGIGKSVLTANLGLALARLDTTVTLVDADLGGSDLHNILGLKNDLPGIGEVLTKGDRDYRDVIHQVLEPGLYFAPGDAMLVATANPKFHKKRKLINALKKTPSDFTLLDLGAGASLTVMDFFLSSPLSLLVMLPEKPAVLNAFNFLKNLVFRDLDREFRQNAQAAEVLEEFRSRSHGPGALDMDLLVGRLEDALTGAGRKARRMVESWRPKLVLNRVRRIDDFVYARQLQAWAGRDLGILMEVAGFLPEDDILRDAAARGRPALDLDPRSPFCRAVALLGGNLAPWSGKGRDWAEYRAFDGSFERTAAEFAHLFPPPGTRLPTRDELIKRLRELESGIS